MRRLQSLAPANKWERKLEMSVGRICVRSVDTAELTDSVLTAAQRMHDRNVGTLVVVDKEQRPLGIITDRDIVVRTVVEHGDPVKATVWEIMSQLPQTVSEDTTTEEALSIMRSGPYRRLAGRQSRRSSRRELSAWTTFSICSHRNSAKSPDCCERNRQKFWQRYSWPSIEVQWSWHKASIRSALIAFACHP